MQFVLPVAQKLLHLVLVWVLLLLFVVVWRAQIEVQKLFWRRCNFCKTGVSGLFCESGGAYN